MTRLSCLKACLRWLAFFFYIFTIFFVIIATVDIVKSGADKHILAWYTAGIFCGVSIPVTIHEIIQHMFFYQQPQLQKYVIRILFMIPIYSIDSWLALRFKRFTLLFDCLRGCYEAFVIFSFFRFLMVYLGGETILVSILSEKSIGTSHVFPMSLCLQEWSDAKQFIRRCRLGCLQYVFLKCFCAITAMITQYYQVYDEGQLFNPKCGYFWVTWIDNCSSFWSLYALVLFYHATYEHLRPVKPFPKFLCVKLVVFFSFWQSFLIDILVRLEMITHTVTHSTDDVARASQNWLICGEMFVFSFAFKYAFSHKDFVDTRALATKSTKFSNASSSERETFLADHS